MLRIGHLAIDAEPLRTPAALVAAGEAMAELGIPGQPPAMWLVESVREFADVADLRGAEPGREPWGFYIHRVGGEPLIVIERGLPELAVRMIVRHELCHLAQQRAGRMVAFTSPSGRWWVLPADQEALGEEEARRYGCDARYWADRIAACLIPPDFGWTIHLERAGPGRTAWRFRRHVDGRVVEERVPAEPPATAAATMRLTAEAFLEAARRDPSIVDRLNAWGAADG